MLQHLNLIHNVTTMQIDKRRQHKCEICSKTYFKKSNLNEHMEKYHVEADWKCNICDQFIPVITCKIKWDMIKHIDSQHEDLKTYKCNYCKESFGTSKQLSSHRKTCSNDGGKIKCEK